MKRSLLAAGMLVFSFAACRPNPAPAPSPVPKPSPAISDVPAPDAMAVSSAGELESDSSERSPEAAIAVEERKILVRDCLLRLPQARRVRTSASPQEHDRLAAMLDDDAATCAILPATAGLPLEIVYHFGGDEVSPRELVVLLPESPPPDASTGRVEVLVSSVSADAGYQFLRADPLEATARVQRFRLRPQGARWVLLRFTAALNSPRVAVSEVALLGRRGPPESNYAFKESPAKAIDLLEKLQELAGASLALTADEAALIDDVQEGRLKTWSLAEAALLVSGVADGEARERYLARIGEFQQQAKEIAGATDAAEAQGERLLRWLHETAMSAGYEAGQTDLHPILDERKFNCVSSVVLYNILAGGLGLDARCVETPEHAFGIVYDGSRHFDVETTTEEGFNPARDTQAIASFERQTGFTYIPDSDRELRRETSEAGMLALVYYNHGVAAYEQGRYPEALAAFFCALSLDSELASASKNALVVLAAWAVSESEGGRFDAARQVAAAGLELAPGDARLRHARVRIWSDHALRELRRSGVDAALAVLRQAEIEAADGPFMQLQAWIFVERGESLLAAKRWEEAIAVVEPGLDKVDPPARTELLRWRGGVFLQWVNELLSEGRFEQALATAERAIRLHPDDARFPDLLAAVARNWLQAAYREEGAEGAQRTAALLGEKAAASPLLKAAVRQAPYWLIIELQEQGKHDDAAALLADLDAEPTGGLDAAEVLRGVFDHWAWTLLEKNDYRGALEVCIRALARLPDDPILLDRLSHVVQRWSRSVEEAGGAAAVESLIAQLKREHPKLQEQIAVTPATAWSSIRKLRDEGEFAAAIESLDRWEKLLDDESEARRMRLHLFDAWADARLKAGDFPAAVDVYEQALRRHPENKHLENNVAAIIQRQALELASAGQEEEAKRTVLAAFSRFSAVSDVAAAMRDYVPLAVQELRSAGKYAEALDRLERHRDLLLELHGAGAEKEASKIRASVYHAWARSYTDERLWEQALDVYRQGLGRFPKESQLREGLAGVYDQWAKTHIKKQEWTEAIAVYDRGLSEAPDARLLVHNRKYCLERQAEK